MDILDCYAELESACGLKFYPYSGMRRASKIEIQAHPVGDGWGE